MENPKQYEVCVIGSACVDFFFEVSDFPKRGETISANRFFDAAGGKVHLYYIFCANISREQIKPLQQLKSLVNLSLVDNSVMMTQEL